jgi:MFS family permease
MAVAVVSSTKDAIRQDESFWQTNVRWILLCLTCTGLLGQFYAYDNPSTLNDQMKDFIVAKTAISIERYEYNFNLLYSVYSLPNIILPCLLGVAIDKCGTSLLLIILSFCVVVGQGLFSIGLGAANWNTMLIGRAILGIGGESLQVAQNCMLLRCFRGREVAFALGLNVSVARAGSVLNDVLSPYVAEQVGVLNAVRLGTAVCVLSFMCNGGAAAVDYIDRRTRRSDALASSTAPSSVADHGLNLNVSLSNSLGELPLTFWLLAGYCALLCAVIFPFNNIAEAFFLETRYSDLPIRAAEQRAGDAMSFLFLVSMLSTPAFGSLIDNIGQRSKFVVASAFLIALTFSTISSAPPMASMAALGLVYMVYAAALYPSLALTVQQRLLGTAFGVTAMLENLGMTLVPLVVGTLEARDGQGRYNDVMSLFLMLSVTAIPLSLLIRQADSRRGLLDLPSREAEARLNEATETSLLYDEDGKTA